MNKLAIAALLGTTAALAAPSLAHAQDYRQDYRGAEVTCASHNGHYRSCRLPMHGQARLVQQLSGSACIRGRSWGENGNSSVWVSRGCRGVFAVNRHHHDNNDNRYGNNDRYDNNNNGDRYGNQGGDQNGWVRDRNYAVECRADGRRTNCAWDTRYGNPYIIERTSGNCVEGRDWGYDSRGQIWVDADCDARFGYH